MIAWRLLPLALVAATAAQAGMATRDVPPPRALQPVGFAPERGQDFVPVAWRETPPVMLGSSDRHVPVMQASGCGVAAPVGMMRDDGGYADTLFEDFGDGFGS